MITITRKQAQQLRAVFRRCGIKPSVHSGQRAKFSTGLDGLHVRAAVYDVAVDYHIPGQLTAEEVSLPLDCLDACEDRRDEPVTLELQPRNRVLVSWSDGGVPQQAQYDAKSFCRHYGTVVLPTKSCPTCSKRRIDCSVARVNKRCR